jgi:nitrate reductase NapAB chaperone NapD
VAKQRRADVTSDTSTVRRLDFTGWDIQWLEISDDLNTGELVVRIQAGNKTMVIKPTLAQIQEIHGVVDAAITASIRTAARMSDHQSAVCFMTATGSTEATFNAEIVHTEQGKCRMCGFRGHDVGPLVVP